MLTSIRKSFFIIGLTALLFSAAALADDIVIGQVAPLSGPLADTGKEMVLGVQVYVDSVNEHGGINGKKIRHVTKDDQYKVSETVRQTKELIEKDNALALIGFAGTGNIGELLKQKILENANIALVGPYTGAEALREPFNRNIFHIRAGYNDETEEMVRQLTTLNVTRIAVMYQNDPFGMAGLAGVQQALAKRKLSLLAAASYEKGTVDVSVAAKTIAAAKPDAVIMISLNKPTAEFSKQLRTMANVYQLLNISVVNPKELVRLVGAENARGIGITQVVPSPRIASVSVIKEYQNAMKKYAPPGTEFSYATLEEFIAAKVLIEGVRRAGANPTRDKIIKALETMNAYDAGGMPVNFSATNHRGSKFVELTIIDKDGKLLR